MAITTVTFFSQNMKIRIVDMSIFHTGRTFQVPVVPLVNKNLKLVDINLQFDSISSTKKNNFRNPKTVVWFNKPVWINLADTNMIVKSFCPQYMCTHTQDKMNITTDSAIIFCMTHPLGGKLPFNLRERNPDQAWIYFGLESPVLTHAGGITNEIWKNTMNWSMNYRLDADIIFPAGSLDTRTTPLSRDYDAIFDRKWYHAAWAVSHCKAQSGRDDYVKEMQDSNLQVNHYIYFTPFLRILPEKNQMPLTVLNY